jgi:hypothetical protein
MPEIVHPICPFELGADDLRGKYGNIDHAFTDLQQSGSKQYVNLDLILDSNPLSIVDGESFELEDHDREDLLENQDSESSDEEEDGGTGEEFLHPDSVKYLGDNKYRVNNSSVVQLDHQNQKVEKTVQVVPAHALSTLEHCVPITFS